MFSFPTLPPWNGLHPLVIHFPIALVLVTPLVVLLALLWKKQMRALLVAAALLMTLAAAGAWLATCTGSAAEEFADKVAGAKPILEEHEELGEAARNFATMLAAALLIATAAFWKWGEKLPRGLILAAGMVFFVANGAVALVVTNAAHQGGRLVHEIGIRANIASGGPASTLGSVAEQRSDRHGSRDKDD